MRVGQQASNFLSLMLLKKKCWEGHGTKVIGFSYIKNVVSYIGAPWNRLPI